MMWNSKNYTLLRTLALLFVLIFNCVASSNENFFSSSKLREKREELESQEIDDSISSLKTESDHKPLTSSQHRRKASLKKQTAVANDKTFLIPHQVSISYQLYRKKLDHFTLGNNFLYS